MIRKPESGSPVAVTANLLRDGGPVWLTADGAWSRSFDDAAIARSGDERSRLLSVAAQAVSDRIVVGPYEMATTGPDKPEPVGWREQIRAAGPTITLPIDRPES